MAPDPEKRKAKHARYNRSEKGLARAARYRAEHRDEIAELNATRIFVCGIYVGSFRRFTAEQVRELRDRVDLLRAEFQAKQAEETQAMRGWREEHGWEVEWPGV